MKLFTRSLHIHRVDEYHRLEIWLNAFEAIVFDWQHYGPAVAAHNFWWQVWH